jgi:hypothetical protein
MFKKIFSFSNVTLVVALALSTIAAWYSIIGLTAIFAGAVIPVIIMGSALEIAKVTTTVWLRKYWHYANLITKLYLIPAIVILALITSMGIFGFLSKAHMDQGMISGDVLDKIALYDEKIKTEKENIDANRKALKQMDDAVDQVMGRSEDEKGADKAVAIRRTQQKERSRLTQEIGESQKRIASLNEERAPIAKEVRKVEAEVGPIKYIAAFIYGDNPDQNILERAVRWVIILLVIVFDPLAIMLVLAANQSKDWDKELEEREQEIPEVIKEQEELYDEVFPTIQELDTDVGEKPTEEEKVPDPEPINCYKCGTELVDAPGIGLFCPNKECDVIDNTKNAEIEIIQLTKEEQDAVDDTISESEQQVTNVSETALVVEEQAIEEPVVEDVIPNFEGVKNETTGEWVQTGPNFEEEVSSTTEPYRKLGDGYIEYEGKRMHARVLQNLRPDFNLQIDDTLIQPKTDFGTNFPNNAHLGDTFVRVDVIPNRIFKFNGTKWVETRRENTDVHLSNDDYLQHLVQKLETGEYDPELLAPNEQDAVAEFIKKQQNSQ